MGEADAVDATASREAAAQKLHRFPSAIPTTTMLQDRKLTRTKGSWGVHLPPTRSVRELPVPTAVAAGVDAVAAAAVVALRA